MDSINRNQPETNRRDLSGSEAIKRVKDMTIDADTCFFCTAGSTGSTNGVRPMSVRKADDAGNLWFLSANDSHKNHEDDPRISVIRFTPQSGYYWDNKHGNLVAGAKMTVGALVGKTLDDSIEGRLMF
jgi:general stress protein 26